MNTDVIKDIQKLTKDSVSKKGCSLLKHYYLSSGRSSSGGSSKGGAAGRERE